MDLNTNIKISIFKKVVEGELAKKDSFIHYWNNTEENFPDCDNIENYLKQYIDSGNYKWIEIQDSTRFVRSKILDATLTLNISDKLSVDQIFVKVEYEDSVEIPQYYYGTNIDVMTNQNNPTNDYTILLELDMWSTFGCQLHKLMKSENMVQHFLANRKMCDRFKYQKKVGDNWVESEEFIIGDPNYRLGLNYMTQPWLLNSGKYDYPLIQATDDLTAEANSVTGMTLKEWLMMNGFKSDTLNQLDIWRNPISVIDCKSPYSLSNKQGLTQIAQNGYIYNNSKINLADTDMPLINDFDFNSNGKYRYLVVKFGSNNTWSYKLETDKTSPGYDEGKINAYNNAKNALKNYPDLTTLLNDVVLGGGKTCITTKKVQGVISNTFYQAEDAYKPIYLNGEVVCLIPIPKGQFEQLYLFYLNSHDKGIVLGDGTILGMVVNDIPPSIFAAALRKYNTELKNPNMQTIGDKVSLKCINKNHPEETDKEIDVPLAWTTLKLDGNWDWAPFTQSELDEINKNECYMHQPDGLVQAAKWQSIPWKSGAIEWVKLIEKHKEGFLYQYYSIQKDKLIPNTYYKLTFKNDWSWHGGIPPLYVFETEGSPSPRDIAIYGYKGTTWGIIHEIDQDEETQGKTYTYYIYYKGGNPLEKSNWYFSGPTEAIIIPPAETKPNMIYKYGSELYPNTYSEHYFPTIFHDFSYIPITVAHKNEAGTIQGQSEWFTIFNQMLTNINIYKTNNRWSEPFLWGPQFYQWVYFTDGLSKIALTADEIDWFKIYKPTWNVNLRTNMSSTTNLKLDIGDIINDNYPFSKSASEFILTDPNKYPFTTEAYNNWFQQNAVAEATSKRAKDITNEFSRARYPVTGGLNWFSTTVGMGVTGASTGTWQGAVAGLATGFIAGGIAYGVGEKKLESEIAEANQKWANEWAGQYGNLYGQPARIDADGFTSGSLLYTPNGPAKESYELFKMFTINPEARDAIGEEIFTSGYPYMRMCEYKDYDNRSNFNIINFNLDEKNAVVNNYLKREFSKNTLIFSQQQFIDWFKAKCKGKMRLFKRPFDYDNMDILIETNIENSMKTE